MTASQVKKFDLIFILRSDNMLSDAFRDGNQPDANSRGVMKRMRNTSGPPKDDSLPVLSEVIRAALVEKSKRQQWLASAVGIQYDTLRSHLKENHYYRSEVRSISESLDLRCHDDPRRTYRYTELAGEYRGQGGGSSLLAAFSNSDRLAKGVRKTFARLRAAYNQAMSQMRDRDISITFSSTMAPPEMERTRAGQEARLAMAESIMNGGLFVYFRPSKETIDKYKLKFGLIKVDSEGSESRDFQFLRDELTKLLQNRRIGATEAQSRVEKHTVHLLVDRCPFWTPGNSCGMIRTFDEGGQAVSRVTVRIPGDSAYGHIEPIFMCWGHDLTASRMASTSLAILKQWQETLVAKPARSSRQKPRTQNEAAANAISEAVARLQEFLAVDEAFGLNSYSI